MENELARAVLAADMKAQYDAQCRKIIAAVWPFVVPRGVFVL